MKVRIIISTLVLALIAGGYLFMTTRKNDPYEVVALIQRNINPKDGSIMDYAGDINFKGFDSVGYEQIGDDKVRIYFGDLQFTMDSKDLSDEKLMASLKQVGITVTRGAKTGKYTVKYKDKEVAVFGGRR